ncbi:MAG: ABC transporter permease [Lachnospiraceae bacterium]|nr:ABC transporter permease [Lachnospiraceae bacterium]
MIYYVKKTLSFLVTLFFIAVISFVLFQVIPGDSAVTELGTEATAEQIEAVRQARGLDDPATVRFFRWMGKALTGDFGMSVRYDRPAGELIADRFAVTLGLGGLSMLMIVLISLPLGIIVSRKEDGLLDRVMTVLSQTVMAVPSFFMGILVTLVFGIVLNLFTPGGYRTVSQGFAEYLGFMVFPALSVALPKIAMTVKFMKSSMAREKEQDYVRTATAKGCDGRTVLKRHILKNSMMNVVTFLGLIFAEVIAGSLMVEQVFNVPGLGRLLVSAIANRDFAIVQGCILLTAVIVMLTNLFVDVLYRVLDPRIR